MLRFLLLTSVGLWSQPAFSDYPADSTEVQDCRRKEFQVAAIRMLTFASYCIVDEKRCGPDCKNVAILDARAGTIYPSLFATADSA